MPSNPSYTLAPKALQEWRSLESQVIESQDTFESVRRHSRYYLLRGKLYFGGSHAENQLGTGTGSSDAMRFEIQIHYPDGTSSGRYVLIIRSGSPSHVSERTLAGILSRHAGEVVGGSIGGSFSGNFRPSYIRIPSVEAVIRQGLVQEMHTSITMPEIIK